MVPRRLRIAVAAIALTVVTASLAFSLFYMMIHAMILMAGIGLAALLGIIYWGLAIFAKDYIGRP